LVFSSLADCLQQLQLEEGQKAFVIGGAQIYALALESGLVNEIFLTHIDKVYSADTFFPDFDVSSYQKSLLFEQTLNDKHEANFEVYQYTK
jgi:dihydrofolate reductase